ncbi:MAG: TetR family transcriptional regulator C-terminal domain-containing protein [Algibacter sp.]|uniref:TetR family transcriptional regulator C-terminal domain-containing protein n=1 Tax=Algibacter sp. TaxID=1872428 RepID=UPI0032984274
MAKKKTISKSDIITLYMDYVLEHNQNPKTIFAFSKMNNFEEAKFYEYFSSFEAVEKGVFETLFTNTVTLLNESENYKIFDTRNKLLSFYYTFFENLTANRSYIEHVLGKYKTDFIGLKILSGLKMNFTQYISELGIKILVINQEQLEKIKDRALKESAWLHLILTMKFWLEDTSASFEKTDIYIEKSVNTTFDVLDIAPLKSVFDLSRFLFKDKFQMN